MSAKIPDSNSPSTAKSGPVIALLGHTGNANLGDEAITESVVLNLKRRLPGVEFRLFSIVPEDSQKRHGYPSFPLRPPEDASVSSVGYLNWQALGPSDSTVGALAPLFEREGWDYTYVDWKPTVKQRLRRLFDWVTKYPAIRRNEKNFDQRNRVLLEEVDLMIFTGSNQFLDNFGGPWAFPYTLLRWAKLAKQTHTPLAFASIGAGPIYSSKSIDLIRQAISRADYVSVRDKPSKELLLKAGCNEPIEVAPDLAFSLPKRTSEHDVDWEKPTIAINPMPIYASNYWYVADSKQYNNFVNALAVLAIKFRQKGYDFFFFATQTKDENVMHDVFARLVELGHNDFDQSSLTHIPDDVTELQQVLASADVIVATRFHGTVIGLHTKKLVLSTSYYRKAADVLNEFELQEYAFQIEDLDAEALFVQIEKIITERDVLLPNIARMQEQYKQELDQQYEKLISLIK